MSRNIYRNRRDLGEIISTDKLLATDYRRYVPVLEEPILQFYTKASSASDAFDPAFTVSSGILKWDLGDGNTLDSNSFSHSYADNSQKLVRVYKGTTSGGNSITGIDLSNDKITGSIDLSNLTSLATSILLYTNSELTEVINPSTNGNALNSYFSLCNISPTLDVTGIVNLGGTFSCFSNLNLYNLYLPVINKQFTTFRADVCGLYLESVDAIFSKLNTWYSSHPPTANLTVNTSGGTNSPPTDGASNTDIINLQSIFSTAGKVLTININY